MNTPDLHTLTGAYAADALSPGERRAFDQHLEECAACRQEVAELTATAARLAVGAAAPAPPSLRERVMAEVANTRQLPPEGHSVRDISPRSGRTWYRQPLAAAAALLLVVSAGLGVVAARALQDARDARTDADRIEALLADPRHVVVTSPVAGGGEATVIAADGQAMFVARDLSALPDDLDYQLWVLDDAGTARSAGVLSPGDRGGAGRYVTGVAGGDSLGLTVEPAGGSEQPTTEPVWLASTSA